MSTMRWDPFEGTLETPDPEAAELEYLVKPERRGFAAALPAFAAAAAVVAASALATGDGASGSNATLIAVLGSGLVVAVAVARARSKVAPQGPVWREIPTLASVLQNIAAEHRWGMRPGFDSMRIARLSEYAPEIATRVKISDMSARDRMKYGAELWGAVQADVPFWAVVTGYQTDRAMNLVLVLRLNGKIGRRIVVTPQVIRPRDDIDVESVEFNDLFVVRQRARTGEQEIVASAATHHHEVFRALSPAVIQHFLALARESNTIMVVDGHLMTLSTRLSLRSSPQETGRSLRGRIDAGARLADLLS